MFLCRLFQGLRVKLLGQKAIFVALVHQHRYGGEALGE